MISNLGYVNWARRKNNRPSGWLNRVRFLLAGIMARLALQAGQFLRWNGTSFPGGIALHLCPDYISWTIAGYPLVVAVTGTNGKTTTSNLIAHCLQVSGVRVACNHEGANMMNGVATALLRDCNWWGKNRSQVAVLEVDEGNVPNVFSRIVPDLVIVTNYFRDQLDRYWEVARASNILKQSLDDLPETAVLLNGDDPLVASVGWGRQGALYYGIEIEKQTPRDTTDLPGTMAETRETSFCPVCQHLLAYRKTYSGQMGDYFCPQCGFSRPRLDFAASNLNYKEKIDFDISVTAPNLERRETKIQSDLRGLYNVYDLLAGISASLLCKVPFRSLQQALDTFQPPDGRMEEFNLNGSRCYLALIKNPTGTNEVLKTIMSNIASKAIVIAINDLAADGRDVSWLWDANFTLLNDKKVKIIICSGRRAYDMAVCLKYMGIDSQRIRVTGRRDQCLRILGSCPADEYYVLATYTNLFTYRKVLNRIAGRKN